jgi:predicted ATPase
LRSVFAQRAGLAYVTVMMFLRTIERLGDVEDGAGFPFELPPVRALRKLELSAPVTFFVGENGSGKSTLLEAIALRAKLNCSAGKPLELDPALLPIHPLARSMRLNWAPPTRNGFFLRVEDFCITAREHRGATNEPGELARARTWDRSDLAFSAVRKAPAFDRVENDRTSPGEQLLAFLHDHVVPDGIYLIDEPEAVLSPQRQLSFMSFLKTATADGSQFIIVSHSPIILAYPGAQLLSFDDGPITPVPYQELTHVNLTRSFLNDPEFYLRNL